MSFLRHIFVAILFISTTNNGIAEEKTVLEKIDVIMEKSGITSKFKRVSNDGLQMIPQNIGRITNKTLEEKNNPYLIQADVEEINIIKEKMINDVTNEYNLDAILERQRKRYLSNISLEYINEAYSEALTKSPNLEKFSKLFELSKDDFFTLDKNVFDISIVYQGKMNGVILSSESRRSALDTYFLSKPDKLLLAFSEGSLGKFDKITLTELCGGEPYNIKKEKRTDYFNTIISRLKKWNTVKYINNKNLCIEELEKKFNESKNT